MKKVIFILLLCSLAQLGFAQAPHLKLGIGAAFGDWASVSDDLDEQWGVGANIRFTIYNETSRFSITPSYIYFPVAEISTTDNYYSTNTTIDVDPEMHYFNLLASYAIVKKEKMEAKIHIGPSFLLYKETWDAENAYYQGSNDIDEFKSGALAGLEFNYTFTNKMGWYLEVSYSYIPDDWDQALINTGLSFRLF